MDEEPVPQELLDIESRLGEFPIVKLESELDDDAVSIPWKEIFPKVAVIAGVVIGGAVVVGWLLGRRESDFSNITNWAAKKQPMIKRIREGNDDVEAWEFENSVGRMAVAGHLEDIWYDGVDGNRHSDNFTQRARRMDLYLDSIISGKEMSFDDDPDAPRIQVIEDEEGDQGQPRIIMEEEEGQQQQQQQQPQQRPQEPDVSGLVSRYTEIFKQSQTLEESQDYAGVMQLLLPAYQEVKDNHHTDLIQIRIAFCSKIGTIADAVGNYGLAYEVLGNYVQILQSVAPLGTGGAQITKLYCGAFLKLGKACSKLKKHDEARECIEAGIASCAPDENVLLGLFWLQKAEMCESLLDDVPHGELPEIAEEGLEACTQASLVLLPPNIPQNHQLCYRSGKARFSLLITVGRMAEACVAQKGIVDLMKENDYQSIAICWETQNYSEILYDFGQIEEAERQLLIALEGFLKEPQESVSNEVRMLRNDYVHKFLFPSGRQEEAQELWNSICDELRSSSYPPIFTENMELRVRDLKSSANSVSMTLQLKRTIASRTSRLVPDTELRLRIVNWTSGEQVEQQQQHSVTISEEQRISNDRSKRRYTFECNDVTFDANQIYIAIVEAYGPGESEPYSVLRQLVFPEPQVSSQAEDVD